MRRLPISLLAVALVSPALAAPPVPARRVPQATTLDADDGPSAREEPDDGVEPEAPEAGEDAGIDDGLDAAPADDRSTIVQPVGAVATPEESETPTAPARAPGPLVQGRAEPAGPLAPAGPLQ